MVCADGFVAAIAFGFALSAHRAGIHLYVASHDQKNVEVKGWCLTPANQKHD